MSRLLLILCFCYQIIYSQPTITSIQEMTVSTVIDKADIYLDGAVVTQKLFLNAKAGTYQLLLPDLEGAEKNALSLVTSGGEEIPVLEAKIVKAQSLLSWQSKKKNTTQLIDSLKLMLQKYSQYKKFLERSSDDIMEKAQNAEEYLQTVETINNRLYTVTKELKKIEDTLTVVEGSYVKKRYKKNWVITINLTQPIKDTIQLNYTTRNIKWYPTYKFNIDDQKDSVVIAMQAIVVKNGMGTWNQVQTTFFGKKLTSQEQGFTKLRPIVLGLTDYTAADKKKLLNYQGRMTTREIEIPADYKTRTTIKNGETVTEQFLPEGSTARIETIPIGDGEYVPITKSINAMYKVGQRQTLFAEKTIVVINKFQVPATYEYYCQPKKNNDIQLIAHLLNWTSYNLLSGKVNLYLNDRYVGKTNIHTKVIQDKLSVSLGKVTGLLLQRTPPKDFGKRKKTIGKTQKITFNYTIQVENQKPFPVNIKVEDQIPIVNNESIQLTPIELSNATYNTVTGVVTWNLTLAPTSQQELSVIYEVTYPKDKLLMEK